jgi:NADH-quinone oxidoreductase subunit K
MILNLTLVANLVFFISLLGIIFNRKNILLILFSLELCLLSINFSLILNSVIIDDLVGQIIAIFVLTVAAAETSIGLSILILYYRVRGSVAIEFLNLLKG